MLDLLDNLPRLRLSDDQLKSIIWVMRECGTPDVPSFSALRKKQEAMTREINIQSEHHTSSLGNHFYMNHPAKLLSLVRINLLISLALANSSRTGGTHWSAHLYIYIQMFQVQYRNRGRQENGLMRLILMISLQCGRIGRLQRHTDITTSKSWPSSQMGVS